MKSKNTSNRNSFEQKVLNKTQDKFSNFSQDSQDNFLERFSKSKEETTKNQQKQAEILKEELFSEEQVKDVQKEINDGTEGESTETQGEAAVEGGQDKIVTTKESDSFLGKTRKTGEIVIGKIKNKLNPYFSQTYKKLTNKINEGTNKVIASRLIRQADGDIEKLHDFVYLVENYDEDILQNYCRFMLNSEDQSKNQIKELVLSFSNEQNRIVFKLLDILGKNSKVTNERLYNILSKIPETPSDELSLLLKENDFELRELELNNFINLLNCSSVQLYVVYTLLNSGRFSSDDFVDNFENFIKLFSSLEESKKDGFKKIIDSFSEYKYLAVSGEGLKYDRLQKIINVTNSFTEQGIDNIQNFLQKLNLGEHIINNSEKSINMFNSLTEEGYKKFEILFGNIGDELFEISGLTINKLPNFIIKNELLLDNQLITKNLLIFIESFENLDNGLEEIENLVQIIQFLLENELITSNMSDGYLQNLFSLIIKSEIKASKFQQGTDKLLNLLDKKDILNNFGSFFDLIGFYNDIEERKFDILLNMNYDINALTNPKAGLRDFFYELHQKKLPNDEILQDLRVAAKYLGIPYPMYEFENDIVKSDKIFLKNAIQKEPERARIYYPDIVSLSTLEEQREILEKIRNKDILLFFGVYSYIPEGLFSPEEQRKYWCEGMGEFPSLTLSYLWEQDKATKELIINDKNFWQAGVEKDLKKVLENYQYIPESVFCFGEYEFQEIDHQKILEVLLYQSDELLELLANNESFGRESVKEDINRAQQATQKSKFVREIVLSRFKEIFGIPIEKRDAYIEVFQKIDESPSQEIQRVKGPLKDDLLETDDPIGYYEQIENVFVENNLPLVGKVWKVFEILHSPEKLEEKLKKNVSPFLRKSFTKRRYYTIYKDLLKAYLYSANRNLRDYIRTIQDGENVLKQAEEVGFEDLTHKQNEQLNYFFDRLDTLFLSSQLGDGGRNPIQGSIKDRYEKLKQDLKVKKGQTITHRLAEMFLKPIGVQNFSEALDIIEKSKQDAYDRSIDLVQKAENGYLQIQTGDLLKGTQNKRVENILQNGSVAKEFLGESSDSDLTPLDTDLSMVLEDDLNNGIRGAIDESIAKNFGDVLFVLKNNLKMQETNENNVGEYDGESLELFQTNNEKHYGIRTGFPSTEIDFIIVKDELKDNKNKLENIFYIIAKNGFYIPITDEDGKIIYTPEMYKEYRKAFDGIEYYEGSELEIIETSQKDKHFNEISNILNGFSENKEKIDRIYSEIIKTIKNVLEDEGIELKSEFSKRMLGAEIVDTGSTGRYTNMPGDFDFDLTLKLDVKDYSKVEKIATKINKKLGGDKNYKQEEEKFGILKEVNATAIEGIPEVDVCFVPRSELSVFETHDAVKTKLKHINRYCGNESYEKVIANIVLTKKILKEKGAYKKPEGGIGGVGVENWILSNNGNMLKAFESFRDAAYENGQRTSLDRFKEKYKILDAGLNFKHMRHDNYVNMLDQGAYYIMLDAIEEYLNG